MKRIPYTASVKMPFPDANAFNIRGAFLLEIQLLEYTVPDEEIPDTATALFNMYLNRLEKMYESVSTKDLMNFLRDG